ncbi:hypothetical protein [Actinopolyspora halophila]|uniref:hypothetical protein n=1 Tax=Actinopolyspora halophila TaxID=1850 RepID=UPI00038176A1|nr:hypothetical protein [Actinopolyspora halophila]
MAVIEGAQKRPFVLEADPVGTELAGQADIGDLAVSRATGTVFTNTGTLATPSWTVVGTQA